MCAVLYGSRKPHSDVDVFMVSDNIKSFNNGWLDVSAVTTLELSMALRVFDIAITDPLFSGTLVIGDQSLLEALRRKVLNRPITQEAINYNRKRSIEELYLASKQPKESPLRRIGLRYSESYSRNAEELENGRKSLTFQKLKEKFSFLPKVE